MIEINEAHEMTDRGYWQLHVKINGKPGVVHYAQKFTAYDVIIVDGPAGEGFIFELPADPDDGRPTPTILENAIQDRPLAEIYALFRLDCQRETFTPGKSLL